MEQGVATAVLCIVAGGIAAQVIASRFRIPAIVLLLGLGFLIGPVLGLLHPSQAFGPNLRPLIGLAVDLRSGYSPPEHVYIDCPKITRNLGVLILVDASASMLSETIVDAIRRRNQSEASRLQAPKWRRALAAADCLIRRASGAPACPAGTPVDILLLRTP